MKQKIRENNERVVKSNMDCADCICAVCAKNAATDFYNEKYGVTGEIHKSCSPCEFCEIGRELLEICDDYIPDESTGGDFVPAGFEE